jgi:hypothetical protein
MTNTRIGQRLSRKRMQATPKIGAAVMLFLGLLSTPASGRAVAVVALERER